MVKGNLFLTIRSKLLLVLRHGWRLKLNRKGVLWKEGLIVLGNMKTLPKGIGLIFIIPDQLKASKGKANVHAANF